MTDFSQPVEFQLVIWKFYNEMWLLCLTRGSIVIPRSAHLEMNEDLAELGFFVKMAHFRQPVEF